MHFSPPNAGNFNKIPEMARWQDGPFPISDGSRYRHIQPDFLQQ
jgi:hypothetical protein